MKLNVKKFMETEMGGELEETIRTWDDGKCSNWRSSSFTELNFSSREQMSILASATKTRVSGY